MQPGAAFSAPQRGFGGGSNSMGSQLVLSRVSIQRQSQVREGGMGAGQGIERGARVACNRRSGGRATDLRTPKEHPQFSHGNYFT